LQLAEEQPRAGFRVIDLTPRLIRTLRLQRHVGELHVRPINVLAGEEEMTCLRSHIGSTRHPLIADLLFQSQIPLLRDGVRVVAINLVDQSIRRGTLIKGGGEWFWEVKMWKKGIGGRAGQRGPQSRAVAPGGIKNVLVCAGFAAHKILEDSIPA